MKFKTPPLLFLVAACLLVLASCRTNQDSKGSAQSKAGVVDKAQVPTWSRGDLDFFLHGSMSTEFAPEAVLKAFMEIYPDLFPTKDFSHVGALPDPAFGWPVGFSRSKVAHLGGLSSVGINCAACHVGDVSPTPDGPRVRVLGMTSHFDAEAFFGSVIISTFRTEDPTNMQRFLASYPQSTGAPREASDAYLFTARWADQSSKIKSAMTNDPSGSQGLAAGALNRISPAELRLDHETLAGTPDLAALAHSYLKLFHNMRAALHVPDQPPTEMPPPSGPGRNDAFGLLSAVLFGTPQPYAPVKYGLVWNVDQRRWVHWDGNTQSPLGRNLLASLGLGAPLTGRHGDLDFALVKRQTDLSEKIRPPRYPWTIDAELAKRGTAHYEARCASCHGGPESDARLYSPAETGTQPMRAVNFTQTQAAHFDEFLASLETPGYVPPSIPGIRSTQKYFAASMGGVWARSPYLHNGSVRTMQELLTPAAARAKTFHRGSRVFDPEQMGYADAGTYLLDTATTANDKAGHEYGTDLTPAQKRELIEYLKTL